MTHSISPMEKQQLDIDELNTEELLELHGELSNNFDDIADAIRLSFEYQGLLDDISQTDKYLSNAASLILTRLQPSAEIDNEMLTVRRGAFAILKSLQESTDDSSASDLTTLRVIIKQRRELHERIPTLIEDYEF